MVRYGGCQDRSFPLGHLLGLFIPPDVCYLISMFGIGLPELIVILIIALLVVGPSKLPEVARSIGKALGDFRRMADDVKETLAEEISLEDEAEDKKGAEESKEEGRAAADGQGTLFGEASQGWSGPQEVTGDHAGGDGREERAQNDPAELEGGQEEKKEDSKPHEQKTA
jgi:sec-independent protein translocase protein TatA